jgi:hypothetical protein
VKQEIVMQVITALKDLKTLMTLYVLLELMLVLDKEKIEIVYNVQLEVLVQRCLLLQ